VTSDALCRPAALTQEGSTPSRSLHCALPPPFERLPIRSDIRRGQDEQCRCLFKATDHTPSRTPSIGLMPDLAIEPERRGLLVLHVRVRALQHPSRASAGMPFLCRGRSGRTALPCPTLMRLAAHLGIAGKMPLTDFCNRHFRLEHPTPIARLPSPQRLTAAETASSQRIPSFFVFISKYKKPSVPGGARRPTTFRQSGPG